MRPDWYVYSAEEYELDNIHNDDSVEREPVGAVRTGMMDEGDSNTIWYT